MLTRILKINPAGPEKEKIETAARVIREGGIVAFPTETVYGLGANLRDKGAVERIYKVKGRPGNKPLTVHIASADTIKEMGCCVSSSASRLMKRFWPGPLTLILESKQGGRTGFRMPKNEIALQLIREAGVPVVAPSANRSGNLAPHSPEDVIKEFNGSIELIIDAGRTEIGVESTVVDLAASPYRILREGAIPAKTIQEMLS